MSQPQRSLEELLQLAASLRSAVRIKDRRYLFRSYPRCFVGQEAVAWFMSSGAAAFPAEAVKLGNQLMELGIFHHVLYEHTFEDDYLFYRFTEDEAVDLRSQHGAASKGQVARDTASAHQVQASNSLQSDTGGAAPGNLAAAAVGRCDDARTLSGAAATATAGPAVSAVAAISVTAAGATDLDIGKAPGWLAPAELRAERMRWQVLAGHLQHLQGQSAHMQLAAEAQRAIADILVSEVNALRGQVSEVRGRLDDTSAALEANHAAAAHLTQQIAGLRLLCLGLCACVVQQALVNWLRPATVTAAAGSGGTLLGSWSGPCWGVALAVTVMVLGLTVLLPQLKVAEQQQQPGGPAFASGDVDVLRNPLAFRTGHGARSATAPPATVVKEPCQSAEGGGASGAGLGMDAASADGYDGGREGHAVGIPADDVMRRSSVHSDSTLTRGHGGIGGIATLRACNGLKAPIRRSITSDAYASSGGGGSGGAEAVSVARRTKEVVRLLTAPMRLHCNLPLGRQAAVHRTSAHQPSVPGLLTSQGSQGEAAAASGGAGTHDTFSPVVSEQEDTIGSRYVSAVPCSDGRTETAPEAAAAAAAPVGTVSQGTARSGQPTSPGLTIPRMSDFDGWPDAPVLIAFHTGLVPEHAASVPDTPGSDDSGDRSTRASEVLCASSRELHDGQNGGACAPDGDASPFARSSASASGSTSAATNTPTAAGGVTRRGRVTGSARSLHPPAPPSPGLVRLRANGVRPIRVETELFSGELVIFLRGLASSPESMFSGKKRLSWVAMQGRFKKPLSLDSLVTGQEFARPFKQLPAAWFVERVLLSMARQISPSMRVGPLSAPAMMMPLISSAQLVNVSKPGAHLPLMDCKEDVRLFCPRMTVKSGGAGGQPAPADTRRRYFSSPRNRAGLVYDTEHVWTFHFWQQFVDLASYRLDFGYTYDLVRHLDGQPLQVMAKDADSGKYLFNALIWNERLLGDASLSPDSPRDGAESGAAESGSLGEAEDVSP